MKKIQRFFDNVKALVKKIINMETKKLVVVLIGALIAMVACVWLVLNADKWIPIVLLLACIGAWLYSKSVDSVRSQKQTALEKNNNEIIEKTAVLRRYFWNALKKAKDSSLDYNFVLLPHYESFVMAVPATTTHAFRVEKRNANFFADAYLLENLCATINTHLFIAQKEDGCIVIYEVKNRDFDKGDYFLFELVPAQRSLYEEKTHNFIL